MFFIVKVASLFIKTKAMIESFLLSFISVIFEYFRPKQPWLYPHLVKPDSHAGINEYDLYNVQREESYNIATPKIKETFNQVQHTPVTFVSNGSVGNSESNTEIKNSRF